MFKRSTVRLVPRYMGPQERRMKRKRIIRTIATLVLWSVVASMAAFISMSFIV